MILCVLILQMIELYQNPTGEIEVSTVADGIDSSNKYNTSTDDHAKIDQLKSTIRSLKDEIERVCIRIRPL